MSNHAAKWSSDQKSGPEDGCTTKPPSGKPTHSKLTGKWKIPEQLNAATIPAASTFKLSDNEQKNPTTTEGGEIDVDPETKKDTGKPPGKLPVGIAVANISAYQEITPSMELERSKGPVEGEILRNRLRIAERLDRK